MPIHFLDAIAVLYPDSEADALIREAFAKDLISAFDFSLSEFDNLLEDGLECTWETSKKSPHHTLIVDAVKDSRWWSVWSKDDPPASIEPLESWEYEPVEQLKSVKVGRNDPCPCQSGKKFKKCCGG